MLPEFVLLRAISGMSIRLVVRLKGYVYVAWILVGVPSGALGLIGSECFPDGRLRRCLGERLDR